jgi:hypothetical protein
MNPNDVAPAIVTVVITAAVWSLVMVRLKSRSRASLPAPELKEILERLERMEQSIDAMAVETERISEGQRFTTKVLTERQRDALPRA